MAESAEEVELTLTLTLTLLQAAASRRKYGEMVARCAAEARQATTYDDGARLATVESMAERLERELKEGTQELKESGQEQVRGSSSMHPMHVLRRMHMGTPLMCTSHVRGTCMACTRRWRGSSASSRR